MLRLLAPAVPHISQALWERLGFPGLLADAKWPEADEDAMSARKVNLSVQVNGKFRGVVSVSAGAGDDECEKAAREVEAVRRHLEGRTIRKVVVVSGRAVNFVAG